MSSLKAELASKALGIKWRKGMPVVKLFYGIGGFREAAHATVTKVEPKTGTIFIDEETGITYDSDGREKENFVPGMRSEITPLL